MIPVENSIAGRVADVHHLLPSSGLKIIGERFKPIHFQLMANPGVKLEDVKTVVSHAHRAGPVPQDAAAAEAEDRGRRRHRRRRASCWPSIPTRPGRHRRRRWRPRSTASTSWPATSRTSTTTPPASW